MSVDTVSRFLAILALVALAGGAAVWWGWWRDAPWLESVRPVALIGAFLVAATAMAGSLYYSEVAHFTPCRLCWYQRIAIYPMALLLAVAAVRRRADVRLWIWTLGVVAAPISSWHYALQTWPSLEGQACDPSAPCSVRWVEQFGFISIPFMALATTIAVTALVAAAGGGRRRRPTHAPPGVTP